MKITLLRQNEMIAEKGGQAAAPEMPCGH